MQVTQSLVHEENSGRIHFNAKNASYNFYYVSPLQETAFQPNVKIVTLGITKFYVIPIIAHALDLPQNVSTNSPS